MIARKITVTIYISEHEDGSKFYEWEVRGVEKDEAQKVLAALGEDLRAGPMVVLKAFRGPKLEEKED